MALDRSALLLAVGLMPMLVTLSSCVAPSVPTIDLAPPPPVGSTLAPPPLPDQRPTAPQIVLESSTTAQGGLLRGQITPASATLTLDGAPVPVAADGRFIIGFDRDAPAQAMLAASNAQGIAQQPVTVTARSWNIQTINAPARGAARSDADFAARRPAELAQMAAARRTVVTSEGWRQNFIWPVTGRISGVFGSQRVYRGEPGNFHNGVDVAVPTGTPYVAPADGVVILAASEAFTLEGYLLMIDHGHGLSSVFLHSSRLDVRTGDVVRQGQVLGAVGATGRTTGPHLHWAMRWSGAKVDAQQVAGSMAR